MTLLSHVQYNAMQPETGILICKIAFNGIDSIKIETVLDVQRSSR